ncbi:hypothetical protein MMP66_05640 [Acinetobacter dispersus]|uniref:hypothetical protein n=1 Tax=Acinetobacter dispersus TaxID=70348 RepID=UPI001F4BA2B2|nr:hypothetical protein [Acinetobacter dispersus]MCH7393763.1 hypothetical protein [Acinetobacter dispersus]
MHKIKILLVLMSILIVSSHVSADSTCDCSQIVGQCSASLKLKSVTGTPPSFSANYSINTTTSSCAKVSYYIDGTPYFNILSNTNSTEDSTFSPKPISMNNFSAVKCEVCKSNQSKSSDQAKVKDQIKESDSNSNFNGTWRATYYFLRIQNHPNNTSVYYEFDRTESREAGNVSNLRVDGDSLVYSWSMGMFGTNNCRFRVTGQNTAEAICTNFTGRHTIPFTRM